LGVRGNERCSEIDRSGAARISLLTRSGRIQLGKRKTIVLFQGGFTFTNFVADAFAVFMLVLWFWLFITVAGDLFRRDDVSGIGKVCWVILLIILPYVGIFAYLLTQGRGMAGRDQARARQIQEDLRKTFGFSVADERLRARLVQ
jgi:hypothetical protein